MLLILLSNGFSCLQKMNKCKLVKTMKLLKNRPKNLCPKVSKKEYMHIVRIKKDSLFDFFEIISYISNLDFKS